MRDGVGDDVNVVRGQGRREKGEELRGNQRPLGP
jgi:hypothetical protein